MMRTKCSRLSCSGSIRGWIHCGIRNVGRVSGLGLWGIATLYAPINAAAAPEEPVSNGGFEELAPDGRPRDWAYVGREARLVRDAHSG